MWCDIYFSHDLLSCLLKKTAKLHSCQCGTVINISSEDLDDEMSGLDPQNTQMCRPWLGQKGYE